MPITTGDEDELERRLSEETRRIAEEIKRINNLTDEEASKEFPFLLPDGKKKK